MSPDAEAFFVPVEETDWLPLAAAGLPSCIFPVLTCVAVGCVALVDTTQ